jgi:bile acid:Na+ symporter, BASS family
MTPIKIAAMIMLIALMLNAGMICSRENLIAVLKNYGLLGRAVLANFIIVPILGVLAVRFFQLNDAIATGLLLMAIAPGVPFVVSAGGRKQGGSLGLAIALAIIMPVLSVVTVPFTAQLVLPATYAARVPVGQFLTTLVLFQLIPLLIGIFVSERAPKLSARLAPVFGIIFLVALVVVLAMLFPTIVKSIASVYGSRGIMAMLFVVVLSVLTGWALAGAETQYRRTLSIATTLRNIGLCSLVATANFAGTLVPAAVMTYLIVQIIVASLVGTYLKRTAKPAAPSPA